MSKKTILLSDETFHQTFLSSYKSIIFVDPYLFVCIYFDKTRKKFIYFFQQNSEIPFVIGEIQRFLEINYALSAEVEKHIIYSTPYVHCVPAAFYNENKIDSFNVLFSNKNKQFVHKSLWNLYLYYIPQYNYNDYLSSLKNTKIYSHIHQTMMQAYYYQQKFKAKDIVAAHLHNKYFELVCLKNNVPCLINTFLYFNADDIIYFIENVVQSLQIKKDNLELILSGRFSKKDELLSKCKDLNYSYKLADFNNRYIYSYRLNELLSHQYSTMFYLPYEDY